MVLFWSRARDRARPDSAWDVLAVATDLPDSLTDRARLLSQGSPRTELRGVAVVLRSSDAFTTRLQSVYLDIAGLYGVVLAIHATGGFFRAYVPLEDGTAVMQLWPIDWDFHLAIVQELMGAIPPELPSFAGRGPTTS